MRHRVSTECVHVVLLVVCVCGVFVCVFDVHVYVGVILCVLTIGAVSWSVFRLGKRFDTRSEAMGERQQALV